MLSRDTLLVRHGQYDQATGELNAKGIRDSELAAEDVIYEGLGASALILSSDEARTLGTAKIIADELSSIKPVIPSPRIREGGNSPYAVEDLDQWIETALDEAGASLEGTHGLIVVTHEPLIGIAKQAIHGSKHVPYGFVMQYVLGSWENPHFLADKAQRLDMGIRELYRPQGSNTE